METVRPKFEVRFYQTTHIHDSTTCIKMTKEHAIGSCYVGIIFHQLQLYNITLPVMFLRVFCRSSNAWTEPIPGDSPLSDC